MRLDRGTAHLVEDLQQKPQSFTRDELIARARKLRYHDFNSPYAAPTCVLVKHLTLAGFADLAERVLDGRYDQAATEWKAWAEETEEGRQLTAEANASPEMREQLDGIVKAAADPKVEAEMRAFMLQAIRTRDFRHGAFSDRAEDRRAN